jgi:hypothetical protein
MMKRNVVIIFCFILALACETNKQPLRYSEDDSFAIYFLADDTLIATEITGIAIDELALAEKPILTISDLLWYNWTDHTFSIKPDAAKELDLYLQARRRVHGVPFVITVFNEPVYQGAFWFAFSSVPPPGPYIELLGTGEEMKEPVILKIERALDQSKPDVRNDERIYRALKQAGILEKT